MDNYKDELLGQNIRYLRQLYGESLEQMGRAVHLGATTISNYESGIRFPDLPKIRRIAHHFNRTVEELLTLDISALKMQEFKPMTVEEALNQVKGLYYLQITEKGMENESFRAGIDMLIRLSKRTDLSPDQLIERLKVPIGLFEEAEKAGLPEASANILWTMITQLSFIYEPIEEDMEFTAWLVKVSLRLQEPKIEAKKRKLLDSIREPYFTRLMILKNIEGWQELGDYYLFHWFASLEPNNGQSPETNQLIGNQLYAVFYQLGNRYIVGPVDPLAEKNR